MSLVTGGLGGGIVTRGLAWPGAMPLPRIIDAEIALALASDPSVTVALGSDPSNTLALDSDPSVTLDLEDDV